MSTDTEPSPAILDPDGDDPDGRHMGHLDEGHTHGPTDRQYFGIFWVLFAITALEVSTYFWESWFGEGDTVRQIGVAVLLTLMLIKFVMIAGFFMHLKFDAALLRRTFVFGLLVAVAVYTVAMTVDEHLDRQRQPVVRRPATGDHHHHRAGAGLTGERSGVRLSQRNQHGRRRSWRRHGPDRQRVGQAHPATLATCDQRPRDHLGERRGRAGALATAATPEGSSSSGTTMPPVSSSTR